MRNRRATTAAKAVRKTRRARTTPPQPAPLGRHPTARAAASPARRPAKPAGLGRTRPPGPKTVPAALPASRRPELTAVSPMANLPTHRRGSQTSRLPAMAATTRMPSSGSSSTCASNAPRRPRVPRMPRRQVRRIPRSRPDPSRRHLSPDRQRPRRPSHPNRPAVRPPISRPARIPARPARAPGMRLIAGNRHRLKSATPRIGRRRPIRRVSLRRGSLRQQTQRRPTNHLRPIVLPISRATPVSRNRARTNRARRRTASQPAGKVARHRNLVPLRAPTADPVSDLSYPKDLSRQARARLPIRRSRASRQAMAVRMAAGPHPPRPPTGRRRSTPDQPGGQPATGEVASEVPADGESQADQANLQFAREATDLALEHLRDQQDNQQLLQRLGWTPEQAAAFLQRWQQMQGAAREQGIAGQQARRRLDDQLRGLGLRPNDAAVRRDITAADGLRGLTEEGGRSAAAAGVPGSVPGFSPEFLPAARRVISE